MADLTKQQLVETAESKLADAKLLLQHGRYANSYYLGGYAIELMLKAVLSARFRDNVLPDPSWLRERDIYSHSLKGLSKIALLEEALESSQTLDPLFFARWQIVLEWKETSRYESRERSDAETLIDAIDDPDHGVFQWLRAML